MQNGCWVTPSPPLLNDQLSPADHGLSGEELLTRQKNLSSDKIFHITAAPCYDKKLEAFEKMFLQLHIAPRVLTVRFHEGASSNGYLVHIFRHMAKELFNEDVGVLTYRTLRNKDFQEVTLERDRVVLLRFEAAYGFRNIQKWS
uniref:Uncharacterized protein n=1 Tax=Myotis myotis TaxID=51298 RepID=A0A7J8AMH7_MYOMY|nr:hypothetical protein mMyoMyo1_007967 [Myotis myotis]